MITQRAEDAATDLSGEMHVNCIVCGRENPRGLHLQFSLASDGGVEASFDCQKVFEGYDNHLHGGVIAALLDGAMTNCLFAHGHLAVTAELTVRYRQPVAIGRPATVRAWIRQSSHGLHRMQAELQQENRLRVSAKATFLERRTERSRYVDRSTFVPDVSGR
jgi:uncharacterized protein (TIGR00369 family)